MHVQIDSTLLLYRQSNYIPNTANFILRKTVYLKSVLTKNYCKCPVCLMVILSHLDNCNFVICNLDYFAIHGAS